ncbi:MAG: hypothetical protein OWQ54_09950 [Sulfolobaceae archaeon]|nr:hypothetical protein [Sulfolobaceae archaeon]
MTVEVDSVTWLCSRDGNRKKRGATTNNNKTMTPIIMGILLTFSHNIFFIEKL